MPLSKPIDLFTCRTCDFWKGTRDLVIGKKEILCAKSGYCDHRFDKVSDSFSCRDWKMWGSLMKHSEYLK